jgi:site-specific recombinase XerD
VRLGAQFGYRPAQRRYFDERSEANDLLNGVREERRTFGNSATALTFEERADAVVALKKLEPLGASLTEASDFFVRNHPNAKKCPAFQVFASEVLKAKKLSCGEHTLATYRSDLRHVYRQFGDTPLNEVFQADVEDFASELDLAPRTICNVLDTFTTFLQQALIKGWINRNPAEFVPRPNSASEPPGILAPEQTARLLLQAQMDRPAMVRPIAVGAFAGLRRAEICRIGEANILLEDLLIDVPAKAAKTRSRRLVTIQDNLLEWIRATDSPKGTLAGTKNPDVFGEWLHQLAVAAGIKSWPHNALRHGFGSHLIALNKNENTTAAEMGNSPDVVVRNYRAVVRPDVANLYFDIRPSNVAEIAARNPQPEITA